MARIKAANSSTVPKLRPALSPEARENQMIALAMDLVEQRLRDGTASSQETTHFLKAASQKSKLELENLRLTNELTAAKTKAIGDTAEIKILYEDALKAMRKYQGQGDDDEYDY
jgi:hypothetical protein